MKARLAILLAGLAFAQAAGAAVFRYASQIDPGTMDPHALASLYHTRVIQQIYEPLVGRDEQFKLEPRLAVSWSMVDPHTWRFKLRPGVKFHDGTPFTADDVVFSVLRSIDPKSQQRPTYPNVTGANKVDDLTVDIATSQPTPILPRSFTNSRMMSKKWCVEHHVEQPLDFKAKEETFAARTRQRHGPLHAEELGAGREDRARRQSRLLGPARQRDRGRSTSWSRTGATRNAGLISGELDFVVDAGVQDIDRLRSMPGITVEHDRRHGRQLPRLRLRARRRSVFRCEGRNPFRDLRVRQAIRYAHRSQGDPVEGHARPRAAEAQLVRDARGGRLGQALREDPALRPGQSRRRC